MLQMDETQKLLKSNPVYGNGPNVSTKRIKMPDTPARNGSTGNHSAPIVPSIPINGPRWKWQTATSVIIESARDPSNNDDRTVTPQLLSAGEKNVQTQMYRRSPILEDPQDVSLYSV